MPDSFYSSKKAVTFVKGSVDYYALKEEMAYLWSCCPFSVSQRLALLVSKFVKGVCWPDKLVWVTMGFNNWMKQHLPVILSVCSWIWGLHPKHNPQRTEQCHLLGFIQEYILNLKRKCSCSFSKRFADRKHRPKHFIRWGWTFKYESNLIFRPNKLKGGEFVAP